jgi:protein gp37
MGESWGPFHGCSPTSIGCANCYAIMRQMPAYGYKNPQQVQRGTKPTFNKPLRWKQNNPQIIFVCPWSDFFIDDPVADQARPDAWQIMRNTPWHTYRITTKRPQNISKATLPSDWPLPNVWLGVSAENQHWADVRMDILRRIPIHPSAIRWVSAEPLLDPIKFAGPSSLTGFGWVIAGGESSTAQHPPRLVNPQLFLDLAAQCKTAVVPYLLKQLGGTRKCKCHEAYGCRAIPPGPNGRVFQQFP